MKKIFILILLIFSYPNVSFSHEDIEKKELTCSLTLKHYGASNSYHRSIKPGWSFKFIKSHYVIPEGTESFQISLEVHFEDDEVLLDYVKVRLKDGNIFEVGYLFLDISEDQYNQNKKIDKCYLIL